MTIVVSVSDAKTSSDPAHVLATYSLGSCIGVALYDPTAKVGGMLHYQLPTSTLDAGKAQANPAMFADTGMAMLLGDMQAKGANKKRMKVKLAGAAQMLDDANLFDIGRRNHTAIRKILWQHGMFLDGQSIGGKTPRNMYLNIADGTVSVKTSGGQTSIL